MADPELETRAWQIVAGMTLNPNFPQPTPTTEEGQNAAAAFSDALKACSESDRLKIAIKNQKRLALINVLLQWRWYVLLKANGNEAIAISSGFRISQPPSPAPPLPKPEAPVLTGGINTGEIVSTGKRVPGALSYLHQYATQAMMNQNDWQPVPSSKVRCVLTNLVPGELYYCRIAAVGCKQQLVYSDIVSRIAA